MKTRFSVRLLASAVLSMWLVSGCAGQSTKSATVTTKASPEAMAAIAKAGEAIKLANANEWIWRDTEKFHKEAQAAADKGDNETAIKLANNARTQAELAVKQYNLEKSTPRGM
jgi:hypothetical protein